MPHIFYTTEHGRLQRACDIITSRGLHPEARVPGPPVLDGGDPNRRATPADPWRSRLVKTYNLPGPKARHDPGTRRCRHLPLLPSRLPVRHGPRPGCRSVGRRRQPLHRLRRRHRRLLHRPQPPQGRCRPSRSKPTGFCTFHRTTTTRCGWSFASGWTRSRPSRSRPGPSWATPGPRPSRPAIKLARHHTGRQQFIGFYGAFHGRTMGALSFTASKTVYRRGFQPMMQGVVHVPFPDPYRPILNADARGLRRDRRALHRGRRADPCRPTG